MNSSNHIHIKSLLSILQLGFIIVSIRCLPVEARSSSRRGRSRTHRGMIESLGALDHRGKASEGWDKIQQHLDGYTESPTQDPDRYGTEPPFGDDALIDISTPAPSASPSISPTKSPIAASKSPTRAPTSTENPTTATDPTLLPSYSLSPTVVTSTMDPTKSPLLSPSTMPFNNPSAAPSEIFSLRPSKTPSELPSASPSLSSAPTARPVSISTTSVLCPDAEIVIVAKVEVWWKYSVEFEESVDTTAAMRVLEQIIGSELEDNLLYCRASGGTRRLDSSLIGGVDYLPFDEPQAEPCPGNPDNCVVYKGFMDLYLVTEDGFGDAIYHTRKSILNLLNVEIGSIDGDGISSVRYLAPDLGTSALQEDQSNSKSLTNGKSLSAPTVVMVSLAVVCVVIALTAGYRYKKRGDDAAAASTIGPGGSQLSLASSKLSFGSNSTPGFAAMMPPSYRLGESHCMDAILEGDSSDTSSQARSSELIVSDSGYSSEGSSIDLPSMYHSKGNILGAHRMDEGHSRDDCDDYLYEESNSDIQSPYDDYDYDDTGFHEFRAQGLISRA